MIIGILFGVMVLLFSVLNVIIQVGDHSATLSEQKLLIKMIAIVAGAIVIWACPQLIAIVFSTFTISR